MYNLNYQGGIKMYFDDVKNRRSVRTFDGLGITAKLLEDLKEYAASVSNPYGIPVTFDFLDAKDNDLSSPALKGEELYVTAKVKKVENADVAYGYSFESLLMHAVNKGLVKKKGVIYKKSLLEIWYAKDWLYMPNSKYSAEDRLNSGMKLSEDYHIMNRENLHSGYILNTKVDGTKNNKGLHIKSEAQNKYLQAIKSIPTEFWPMVRKICIEENDLQGPPSMSERQKTYFYYLCRIDLCRGLDRLTDYYNQKLKVI